jgi:DNA-binding NarL/FixJ family response regulator
MAVIRAGTQHDNPESERATIRVVIADDQALVRRGTALLLSMAPDMECVGQAKNGEEAVKLAQLLQPDVILMDLHMPIKGGVTATREITLAQPTVQVLVLTTLDDDETVFEAVRAGAAPRGVASHAANCAQGDGSIQTIGRERVTRPLAA